MPAASLLIIHQGALGDFILTFPALTRLHKYHSPIDVLSQSQQGKLAKTLGLAQNGYPLESAYFATLFSDRIDPRMRTILEKYETIILFSLSDTLEKSINRVTSNLKCRLPPKPPADHDIHVAQFVLDRVFECGLITQADAQLDDIPFPAIRSRRRNQAKILLHPGAGSIRKRWPLSGFLQVETALKESGLMPEFILGPAEENLEHELKHTRRVVHMLDDPTDLVEMLDSAGGYIGNDSGASHLAAYLGLPTTVIFGPADPARWAPLGRSVQIVRPGLKCRPCFETEPDNCDEPQCLAGTSPQTVLEAFYGVYSNPDKPEQLK